MTGSRNQECGVYDGGRGSYQKVEVIKSLGIQGSIAHCHQSYLHDLRNKTLLLLTSHDSPNRMNKVDDLMFCSSLFSKS